MSDLAQFTNKTLVTNSPIGDMLSRELSKSGMDYAMESMSKFAGYLSVSKRGNEKGQISQSLDEYENVLLQQRQG